MVYKILEGSLGDLNKFLKLIAEFWNGMRLKGQKINPQISQITQIKMNVQWRLRNLPGLIPRSLLRLDRIYHKE